MHAHEWIPALIGMGWAVWQWVFERGLWLDEASLGLNLLNRHAAGLLQPLDYGQAAPVLYLQITKLSAVVFGPGVKSMRFPALLCFAISLLLFMGMLRRTVSSPGARVIGLSMFCFNLMILRFSGELKQYMTETMVCLAILYTTHRYITEGVRRPAVLLGFGLLSIGLSHTAANVLAMSGAMMLLCAWQQRDRQVLTHALLCGMAWLAGLLAYYALFVRNHPSQPFMQQYWSRAGGFGPGDVWSRESFQFLMRKLELMRNAKNIFHIPNRMANASLVWIPLLGWLFGTRRRMRHLLLLPIPLLLHFSLSYLHIYPFEIRLTLYLLPLTILAVVMGLDTILRGIRLDGPWAGWGMLVLCVWQASIFQQRFLPIRSEELKMVAISVRHRIQPGDQIWLSPDATFSYEFYERTGVLAFPAHTVTYGKTFEPGGMSYSQQVADLQSDVWLLLTHIKRQEMATLLAELKARGYRASDSLKAPQAYAYRLSRP